MIFKLRLLKVTFWYTNSHKTYLHDIGALMLKIIKIKADKIINNFLRLMSLRFYGNSLGIKTNRNWHELSKLAKKNYKKTIDNSDVSNSLKRTRLEVLGISDSKDLQNYVHEYFEAGKGNQLKSAPQILTMDIDSQKHTANWIFAILQQFANPVESFFESYFEPYHIIIQKTVPGATTADTSFGWHVDDNPDEYIKLFIYLNDVSEENGAFRAFDLESSQRILQRKFKSYSPNDRIESQPIADKFLIDNPESLKILEGPAGTVLAFDNNLVHKGTAPRIGFRYAIQIPVIPSLKPLSLETVEKALTSPRLRDYPADPFINDHGF